MQFHRLRLSGFKSFVDPTELYIEPGMTAVVGPNGCGKSNLIEALRWVMGENSPKSMRGSGMDDVIFAGTMNRPPRNLADVTLLLDNSQRKAPPGYNAADHIEVSRRIEREAGSAYRINGAEVRQRDVQLLFADAATGPHSPAMVSQGRIGALIAAKPRDRRAILEEAAGISGLHSRRHEAELRLRAAENNLVRLRDVMIQIDEQLASLRRQARQAKRYKSLSARIRQTEALLLHVRWAEAQAMVEAAAAQLVAAEREVADFTSRAARASTEQAEIAAALPGLRQEEAEASAALHRLAAARDSLDVEERRAREAAAELGARLEHIADDSERERAQIDDAVGAIERLDQERAALEPGPEDGGDARREAERAAREAADAAREAEARLDALNQEAAATAARRASLEREIEQSEARLERLGEEAGRTEAEIAELREAQIAPADGDKADQAATAAARRDVDEADAAMAAADRERLSRNALEAEAREALNKVEAEVARLNGEASALAELLAAGGGEDFPPVIDSIAVEAGYEAALGAALGDDLSMPLGVSAPIHWEKVAGPVVNQKLPEGVEALSSRVKAPLALARRLSQIGVVDAAEGAKLRSRLLPGQRLVSKDGDLWRWDGYTVAAGAMTIAASRLEQRNRLEDIWAQLGEADRRLDDAREKFEVAHGKTQAAVADETRLREARREAEARLADLRERRIEAHSAADQGAARLAALESARERLTDDVAETEAGATTARAAAAELADESSLRARIDGLRPEVENLRTALAEARGAADSLEREAGARIERLKVIGAEREEWQNRVANARAHLERLTDRDKAARGELARIEGKPREIEQLRHGLIDRISEAETRRGRSADLLAEAEVRLAQRDGVLKESQQGLARAREERVRVEAARDQAGERLADVEARIAEDIHCLPHEVAEAAGIAPGATGDLADAEATALKYDSLRRQRDNMGPVNLRADVEAEELGEQLTLMNDEHDDLEAAIGRLRQAISSLNREGRERLLAAFSGVDKHFQELFRELFGGGKAHLALTESDDPLEAGLEIMASPPGKKLQILSLLSGGEQALTALALIFAVFLTNPAPICVLDEVDAPLDDANVERFCNLMEHITKTTGTRFLIVTHNPITMSRVDRLFGVTMAERGISQLVSVDLGEAELLQAVG